MVIVSFGEMCRWYLFICLLLVFIYLYRTFHIGLDWTLLYFYTFFAFNWDPFSLDVDNFYSHLVGGGGWDFFKDGTIIYISTYTVGCIGNIGSDLMRLETF